jgi:Fur family ferric uptake transcriptional regulator
MRQRQQECGVDLESGLHERGYRLTPQREAVYDVLLENAGRPLSPEEIRRECAGRAPGTGAATVYRCLDLFCQLGIAQHVHFHESAHYYELCGDEHHHHLVCVACGQTTPIESCMVEEMEKAIRSETDFLVTSHCLSLFGYCSRCRREGVA